MTTRADVEGKTVHFRHRERILCGTMPDDFGQWPRGHIWISDPIEARKLVNCAGCLAARDVAKEKRTR